MKTGDEQSFEKMAAARLERTRTRLRRRRAQRDEVRAAFAAARTLGLSARHAAKLARATARAQREVTP